MKQLTGIDANFLYMETPSSFGHVSSLVVYQRPDPDFNPYAAFREQMEKRLHLFEPSTMPYRRPRFGRWFLSRSVPGKRLIRGPIASQAS